MSPLAGARPENLVQSRLLRLLRDEGPALARRARRRGRAVPLPARGRAGPAGRARPGARRRAGRLPRRSTVHARRAGPGAPVRRRRPRRDLDRRRDHRRRAASPSRERGADRHPPGSGRGARAGCTSFSPSLRPTAHYTGSPAPGVGVPGPVSFRDGRAGVAADHARLGPLPGPRAARPRARLPGRGRQRREHHGARRALRRACAQRRPRTCSSSRSAPASAAASSSAARSTAASDGCAGDIGHIQVDAHGPVCACGNVGCLEALFGGAALARDALAAARSGASPALAERLAANGVGRPRRTSADGAAEGDVDLASS